MSALFLPREHGATAMMFLSIICAAALARQWRWSELVVVIAAAGALSSKEPLVLLARQRFVRKRPHPETALAMRWCAIWAMVLSLCGIVLAAAWPLRILLVFGLAMLLFLFAAVVVNVKNRQRSVPFQMVSTAVLTSSCLATSISASGSIPGWCWWLWLLLAMQSGAGVLVVHARLDARAALRGTMAGARASNRSAMLAAAVLAGAAAAAAVVRQGWIALAFLVAAAGYGYELRLQRSPEALRLPLPQAGLRALALASLFALLVMVGLW